MKKSKVKMVACVLSAAVMFAAGGVLGHSIKADQTISIASATTQSAGLSMAQLEAIALSIIPGTVVSRSYDYEAGQRVVEFDILNSSGLKREITLFASNGKVFDIDYDHDEQGNRFINQSLFTVNTTFEQAQATALARVPGTVLAYKQDADYGKFIYEFIIKGTNGLIYEVDVETETGTVIKVEVDDDYNYGEYMKWANIYGQANTTTTQQTQTSTTTTTAPSTPAVSTPVATTPTQNSYKTEAELRAIVLAKVPGTVLYYKQDWDDGMLEYEYKIRNNNGWIVDVEITATGWIKDIDYDD